MQKLIDRWNHFWFAPDSPANLGFCRLLVMLAAFFYYRTTDLEAWGFFRHSFWQPIPLFSHLHWHPLPPMSMWSLGVVWKISMLLGGIGLFSRLSCGLAFALGLYLLGLSNNIGKVDHSDGILLWAFLLLSIARSGDAWSLDAMFRAATGRSEPLGFVDSPVTAPRRVLLHAEYRWPVRMMQVLVVGVFFLSSIAKLRTSGVAWALSDNFQNTLIAQHYIGRPIVNWGLALAHHPALCQVMALAALGLEIIAPLALLGRLFARLIIPFLFLMQIGNELLLGVRFRQFMICYAFWVSWKYVGAVVLRTLTNPRRAKVAVLFDGSCGLCKRTMNVLRRLDVLYKTEILDVTNDWATVAGRYPALNQPDCLYTMHVVDDRGIVTTGFFAYRTLCKFIPLGWPIPPFLYLPGVPIVGEMVYQKVADGRFRTGCALPAATIAPADLGQS